MLLWDVLLGFSLASCFKDLKMNIIRAIAAGRGWSGSSEWTLDTPSNRMMLRKNWGFDCLIEGQVIADAEDVRKFLAQDQGLVQ